MRAVACLAMLVSVAALGAVGCGDDDAATTRSVTQLVGPEGGTVELVGAGKVVIPPGALAEATSIKISELKATDIAELPDNMEAAGKPVAFEPHGKMFSQAVTVELPIEGTVAEVRPLKLDDDKDTSWTTVFPSTVDSAERKLSLNTTSFSVIIPARPRANSGVITLPDGAIVSDAAVGLDSGTDAGADAAMAVDAGSDAAVNMTPCTATATAVTAIATPGEVLVNGNRTLVTTGSNVLTAYTGTGTGLTAAGALITLPSMELFNDVATGGSVVAAVTQTIGEPGNVIIVPADGSSAPTFYNLITNAPHAALFDFSPQFSYDPTGRLVATNGSVVAVAMTTGSLILLSATTGQPIGFLGNADTQMGPVRAVIGMEFTGNYLVTLIHLVPGNQGAFAAIRVFDISDPANITVADDVMRPSAWSGGGGMIADPARNRFLISLGVEAQVVAFTVDGTGQVGAETVIATGITGAQAREMAVAGDLLLLGNPNFTAQPVDVGVSVFGLTAGASVSRGVIDLPDGDYSTSMAVGGNFLYSAGTTLNAIDLTSCLTP